MRQKLPTPSVPDLARVKGDTPEEAAKWLIDHFNLSNGIFNYVRSMRAIKSAYRGLHNIDQLVASCEAEKTDIGRKSNKELVECVAPIAFGRNTQVFDLPARKFAFGHRQSGFRVPFFFVEDGKVKLYCIWPRKGLSLSMQEMSMIATIYRRYLLDTEFYDLEADIEFIESSRPIGGKDRVVDKFTLNDFEVWTEERLGKRLTLISQALEIAENSEIIKEKKRRSASHIADMPLFN